MTHIIDIRALQGAGRSGVEVYIEGFLKDFFVEKQIQDNERVILWGNAFGEVKLPGYLKEYVRHRNVFLVKTRVPSKILNISCSIFRWPKIDRLKGVRELIEGVSDDSDEVVLWVLDPRPSPVSKLVKKYLVVHDISSIKFPHFFSLRTKIWFCLVRLRTELKEANLIYAVSKFTKSELLGLDPSISEKTQVKYPFICEVKKEFTDEFLIQVRDKYALPKSKYLLSLSTLEPRKNINSLIEKFLNGDFPSFEYLVISGEGNSKIFKETKYEKDSNIIFTSFVPEEDKWALYSMAGGFVCLSRYEGYGLPVKEAICFGLPLILSDIPVFHEVIEDYKDVTWVQI